MSAGWLSNKYSAQGGAVDSSRINNLVPCKEDNCMAYKNGECSLMAKVPPMFPILRTRDIKGE